MKAPAGNAASYLEAARNLAPRVQEVRHQIEQDRKLPAALVDAMTEGGFFRLWVCHAFEGPELDFAEFLRVIEELSRPTGRSAGALWSLRAGVDFPGIFPVKSRARFSLLKPIGRQRQSDRQGGRGARRVSRQRALELRELHPAQSLDRRQLDHP